MNPVPSLASRGRRMSCVLSLLFAGIGLVPAGTPPDAPPSAHRQLPDAMHGTMTGRPAIRVGHRDADLTGTDHRVLQAAVDYVAALGGGLVEIGPGEYWMRDSLHLRPHVTVRGHGAQTVLRKAPSAASALELDGDYGEEQITLRNPGGFEVGDGVAIWDRNAGGFHTTVARITGRNGNTFAISLPLNADCMVESGAQAATVFPVVSGYHLAGVRVENITIEGSRDENVHLNGCRGAGIFLYRCPGAVLERCTVRNFNGDGISFQQCNDVRVLGCVSEGNASLGLHPGSGSQRPEVRGCLARNNGEDGLFLCWRVKHGVFEDNTLAGNGRFGISIGHKDTDNLLRRNRVLGNGADGIFFRNETAGMAGHRNRIEDNLIENNGASEPVAGIRVRGETTDLVFRGNIIRDTRPEAERRQRVGIRLDEQVGVVVTEENRIEAETAVEDRRSAR
ncbi:MAG: right-handed parallel beta-helix repeat-containing protein [Verrucomicrobiae bacterium]|nr:right-handed parallel beta-helix repeat-containing protein [Verrucomicrobiae bacterium]